MSVVIARGRQDADRGRAQDHTEVDLAAKRSLDKEPCSPVRLVRAPAPAPRSTARRFLAVPSPMRSCRRTWGSSRTSGRPAPRTSSSTAYAQASLRWSHAATGAGHVGLGNRRQEVPRLDLRHCGDQHWTLPSQGRQGHSGASRCISSVYTL